MVLLKPELSRVCLTQPALPLLTSIRLFKILEVLNHPNIVRFREVYKTKKGKLCIVMDFADGGDLQGKIKEKYKTRDKQGGNLQYWSEDHVLNWFT